jgi:hypothetical protein
MLHMTINYLKTIVARDFKKQAGAVLYYDNDNDPSTKQPARLMALIVAITLP